MASAASELVEVETPQPTATTQIGIQEPETAAPATGVAEKVANTSQPTETKKCVRKQRLVSYSSNDSNDSQETTASRKSGRKPTAVNRMGGVMIDHLSKKTDQ